MWRCGGEILDGRPKSPWHGRHDMRVGGHAPSLKARRGAGGRGCCMGGRSVSCGPRTGSWPHAVRMGAEEDRGKMLIGWVRVGPVTSDGPKVKQLSGVEQGRSLSRAIGRMMSSVVGG